MSPSLPFRLFCPTCQQPLPPTGLHLPVVTERGLHKASFEACIERLIASVNLSAEDVVSPQPCSKHTDLAVCLSCPTHTGTSSMGVLGHSQGSFPLAELGHMVNQMPCTEAHRVMQMHRASGWRLCAFIFLILPLPAQGRAPVDT